jgi:hypothetical protein
MVDEPRIEALGDHDYRVSVAMDDDVVSIRVRATPDVVARVGGTHADEARVVAATMAFLTARQGADDLPQQLDLDDVVAAYGDAYLGSYLDAYVEELPTQLPNPDDRSRASGPATESLALKKNSLIDFEHVLLAAAHRSPKGYMVHTLYGGHQKPWRQSLIALTAGTTLSDQDSRGEATLHVLRGHVQLTSTNSRCDCTVGDHLIIPRARQCLEAIKDSVVLLTVAKYRSND